MFTQKGRTMIITGGAGNNGLAIVRDALANGMNVAFMSSFHGKGQDARNKILKEHPEYESRVIAFAQNPQARLQENIACAPDIYNEDTSQEDVLEMIYEKFGSIDVVVNGSGGHDMNDFEATDKKVWHHSMEIVEGMFFNTKLALPYLKKAKHPRVINITTDAGIAGNWYDNPSFTASRGGMIALTAAMAKELGKYGITVNTVLTGHIEGDVPEEDTLSEDMRSRYLALTPLGRLGEPKDIAGIVNFLSCEEAGFITGQIIAVNGGSLL